MKSTKVLTQEKKEEKIINIFDLDGCSMKQVFPNTITEVSPAKMISKLQDITLFPAFLRYYLLSSRKTIANIFITGRRKSNYERITKDQLRPAKAIKSYEIRYFNEDWKHIQENIVSFFGIKEESFSQLLNKRHEN